MFESPIHTHSEGDFCRIVAAMRRCARLSDSAQGKTGRWRLEISKKKFMPLLSPISRSGRGRNVTMRPHVTGENVVSWPKTSKFHKVAQTCWKLREFTQHWLTLPKVAPKVALTCKQNCRKLHDNLAQLCASLNNFDDFGQLSSFSPVTWGLHWFPKIKFSQMFDLKRLRWHFLRQLMSQHTPILTIMKLLYNSTCVEMLGPIFTVQNFRHEQKTTSGRRTYSRHLAISTGTVSLGG